MPPAPKLRRWIDLLAALLRRNYPATFEELARDVPGYQGDRSVSARRQLFERDKKELRMFGIPLDTTDAGDGEMGYRLRREDFYLPYLSLRAEGSSRPPQRVDRHGYRRLPHLVFEPEDLAIISAAASHAVALGIPRLAGDIRSALRKLGCDLPVAAAGTAETERVVPEPGSRIEDALFETLLQGVRSRKNVRLRYRSLNSGTERERTVSPLGLFFHSHHWYLAAVDEDRVCKNFRLGRMAHVRMNLEGQGEPDFDRPPGFDLARHARSREAWELGQGDALSVHVVVRGTGVAAQAIRRLGKPIEGDPDYRSFAVRRPDTFLRWLLSASPAVQVVAPESAVAAWRELARVTLTRYTEASA